MQNKYQYLKTLLPCLLILVLTSDAMARRFLPRPVRDSEINRKQANVNWASRKVTTKFANKGIINYHTSGQSIAARMEQAIKWLSEAPNDPIVHKYMEILRKNSNTSRKLQLSAAQFSKVVDMVLSASRTVFFDPVTALWYSLERNGIKKEEFSYCRI